MAVSIIAWVSIGIVIGLLISHYLADRPRGTLTVDPDEEQIIAFEIDIPVDKLVMVDDFRIKVKQVHLTDSDKKDTPYNAVI